MRTFKRLALGALVAVAAAAAPSYAAAATLALPGACGAASDGDSGVLAQIPYSVSGLAPNAPYTVTANGATVGSGTTDAGGAAIASFQAPYLSHRERAFAIAVTDGVTTATGNITLTTHSVVASPSSGKPNRRIKIRLFGWPSSTVYLHFIAPGKKTANRTVRIGKTSGVCGHATKKLRHLYSTARPKAGVWHLVFDTKKKYKKDRPGAIVFRSTITRF